MLLSFCALARIRVADPAYVATESGLLLVGAERFDVSADGAQLCAARKPGWRQLTARERQMPALLRQAQSNLQNPPRIFTEIALNSCPTS